MVAVEVEEGEDFVACEISEGKVGLDQCKLRFLFILKLTNIK